MIRGRRRSRSDDGSGHDAAAGRAQADLLFVFACNVSAHGVVAGEGARTEGTMYANALMTLADVCT